jgi:multidrug transporter EmrE-like cation transporter
MATNPQRALLGGVPTLSVSAAKLLRQWPIAFAASSLFVVCGHSLIKAGLNAAAHSADSIGIVPRIAVVLSQPLVIEGLFIYFLGTICWMTAVAQKEISFLYPLTSVNYVMVAGTSILFFHEVISFRRAAGVIVIVLGMFLMNRQSSRVNKR